VKRCSRSCPTSSGCNTPAMTGQSLFYMGEADLKHKGARHRGGRGRALCGLCLKLLQSEGVLTIASTGQRPEHRQATLRINTASKAR